MKNEEFAAATNDLTLFNYFQSLTEAQRIMISQIAQKSQIFFCFLLTYSYSDLTVEGTSVRKSKIIFAFCSLIRIFAPACLGGREKTMTCWPVFVRAGR